VVDVAPAQTLGVLGTKNKIEPAASGIEVDQERTQPAPSASDAEGDPKLLAPSPPRAPMIATVIAGAPWCSVSVNRWTSWPASRSIVSTSSTPMLTAARHRSTS
jgi:hypothetical protein